MTGIWLDWKESKESFWCDGNGCGTLLWTGQARVAVWLPEQNTERKRNSLKRWWEVIEKYSPARLAQHQQFCKLLSQTKLFSQCQVKISPAFGIRQLRSLVNYKLNLILCKMSLKRMRMIETVKPSVYISSTWTSSRQMRFSFTINCITALVILVFSETQELGFSQRS